MSQENTVNPPKKYLLVKNFQFIEGPSCYVPSLLPSEAFILIAGEGMPSIASVDLADMADMGDEVSLSESSDLQKARKLYAELQAMSMESTGSFEVRRRGIAR